MAEEALEQLESRAASQERELQDLKLKVNKKTSPVSCCCIFASAIAKTFRELTNNVNLFPQSRLNDERNRLSEMMTQVSPINLRTDENCQTPRRLSQAPYLSGLDR